MELTHLSSSQRHKQLNQSMNQSAEKSNEEMIKPMKLRERAPLLVRVSDGPKRTPDASRYAVRRIL